MKASTLRNLIAVTLIALWEVLPRTGLIPELFLPSLSSTLIAGWLVLRSVRMSSHDEALVAGGARVVKAVI